MNSDGRLAELLSTWQEAHARGETVRPEDLCRDVPELLPELSRRLAILGRVEAIGQAGTVSVAPEWAAAVPSLPAVGEEFGGLGILAVLGEGGMGRVYRAADPVLRREVALKVMKPEVAARPEARERFLREARALAALRHDHVAPVYQVGEVHGVPFLVMPLLVGESLAARLAPGEPLPPAEVLRIGREAAEGLAAVHARGLIHRDVKPANVWLEVRGDERPACPPDAPSPGGPLVGSGTGGRVLLLDFGLARPADAEGPAVTCEGALVGTPEYMSPEQADGRPLDLRTDLFSLGAVLYECATGQRAFAGKTLTAILVAVTRQHPPAVEARNPRVPAPLAALIGRLLAKDPAERPPSARAVVEAIDAIERGQETIIHVGPAAHPAGRQGRRRLGPWLAAAAGAMLLALLGFHFLENSPRSELPPPAIPDAGPVRPLVPELDVRVWKNEDRSKGLSLGEAGALPLRAGDHMRIEARTNREAYLYVIYVDARGESAPLFPWRKNDWDDRPAEEKRPGLNLPEEIGTAAPLEDGPSGIEAVLLLARDEPLSAAENIRLRGLFAQAPAPGKFDPLRGAVWLGAQDRFGSEVDRGRPSLDHSGRLVDPVERMRRLVRTNLKALGAVSGVCYPFQGK